MASKVSVVVRVRDEVINLSRVLTSLRAQQGVELQIIVVDNGSTDGSWSIAQGHADVVVDLPRSRFSYPLASNLGLEQATHEVVCLQSAHSFPMRDDWLAGGLTHLNRKEVAGVYCRPVPRQDLSLTDRYAGDVYRLLLRFQRARDESEYSFGQLGSTNCLIRRSLWTQHPFDESYGSGGEDGDWARWAIAQGYVIVNDPAFAVWHSHGLGPIGWLRQFREWKQMNGQPFSQKSIAYRRSRV
jgi:glycosyltransferase involved in cell wall biosynthesis